MDKVKSILKWICNIMMFLGAVYAGLGAIWHFPLTHEMSQSIIVICGLLGAYFGIDTAYAQYKRKKMWYK